MRKISCVLLILLILSGCARDFYPYKGEKYLWCKDLDKALRHADKVKALDLSNQNLTEVPTQVAILTDLRFLSLKNNNISTLPDFIYRNQELQTLLLYNNINLVLEPSIKMMTNLAVLEVIRCDLDSLPKEIFQLKNLRRLAVSGNNFTDDQIAEIRAKLPNCLVMNSVD